MKSRKLVGALLAIGIAAVSSAQAQEAHKLALTTELGLSTMWNTGMNVSPFGLKYQSEYFSLQPSPTNILRVNTPVAIAL